MTEGAADEERARDPEPEEFDELDEVPHRRRVDPEEVDDYDEWRKERQQRGRKRRRQDERGRHRPRDEDAF